MWGTQTGEMLQRRATGEVPHVPMHNVQEDENGEQPHVPEEAGRGPSTSDSTAVPSPEDSSEVNSGVWGERDVGGPVTQRMAMEDYENMRRELTRLSLERSQTSHSRGEGLFRVATGRSSRRPAITRSAPSAQSTEQEDIEKIGDASPTGEEKDFELGEFLQDGYFGRRTTLGESAKKVGVVFRNLTVKGVGGNSTFVRTLPHAILGTFGPDLYRILSGFIPAIRFGNHGQTRDLIHDFTGTLRDGQMMLVLGRPGAGCSTFLKAIANQRDGYADVTGDVHYGGITAEEQRKKYRGEVAYNPEDDQHFPSLNVWQTLKFALLNKTKRRENGEVPVIIDALLKMFGISHTKYTLVGNEYVRGVSGGERKRVSIAETLATKSTVVCWDNSTRGLDASTALDYANSLRIMTDVSNRTTFVTLYQAGEDIFKLMDKVLVIEQGRMIFQGEASRAKQYFIELGFHCPERETTADFLTSIGDPNERQFRDGFENRAPKTAEELEKAFRASPDYKALLAEVDEYETYVETTEHADARRFQKSVNAAKSKHVPDKSSYTVSFPRQVLACTKREFWLLWGDKTTLYTKAFIIVANGLIVGSLFYGTPDNTDGVFARGGTAFFSILFLGWLQLTELMKAVSGRVIIARHKEYAFYRPSAVVIARVLADFPILLPQVTVFSIVMYFLSGFAADASKFFIYFLFVYTTTICMTSLYRMFASLSPTIDDAVRFSGLALNLLIIYTGYVIPKPQLLHNKIWFGWLYYINPISYSFEGVLTNQFHHKVLSCAPDQLVPQGPGVTPEHQGCAITGAQIGSTTMTGERYLSATYEYTRSHLWRNWGVVIAFAVLYILITAVASESFSFVGGGGGALVFKKSKRTQDIVKTPAPADEEKGGTAGDNLSTAVSRQRTQEEALQDISCSESIFTWSDVEYSVPYQGGQRKLLNKVNGFAKPGVMVALMGASGAGKTTLLNTLSQRQRVGVVSGEMLVDGRPPGPEFQRGTGFCEQMDLHDGTATIREALEFSAILRQSRDTPREEKIAYVDNIIDLLELGDMQDAIVGSLGVEQRKRLTIGVELAAKPNLLLFLDEPTSGLDSQSAFSIIRFLRKLASAGQAIICTIHQPSTVLIQQFDMILALNPGGNTFYFGPVGNNGSAVISYFAKRGAHCPPDKNVAEFILETAAKGNRGSKKGRINWNEEWSNSDENKEMLAEIERIKAERINVPLPESQVYEFASPLSLQTTMLTQRLFRQYWRSPSYIYGKLFIAVIIGIFNGFTFWQLGHHVSDLQDRLFTAFLIIVIPPTIVNSVLPKFFQNMALWQARELPSRIYSWPAFCTAQIICEIPSAIIMSVIYFLLWYFPAGLPTDASTAGYVYLMTLLFMFFMNSWGQWICSFAPSFTVISNILPFFFVIFSLFNGVVKPYRQLSVFWRYWLYYLNPSTYWIGGVLSATLKDIQITCTDAEAAHFTPPEGQSCFDYAGAFATSAGGYLLNPDNTTDCAYCPYSSGTQYLTSLNLEPKDKWGYFGIFLGFCISNWFLVYFFIYTVRIRGWSFGFGTLFGLFGKVVDGIKGLFRRKK
ncbi:MAG: hypothetical protein M1834_007158 [Cirrosporium novae-zelandiae]|nr:MAG: hypothetical protein M1834_007158 [Cirrosporium novae-zelandiae]